MRRNELTELLMETPIIAAIKNDVGLERCLGSESHMVFILLGNICNISDIVSRIKKAGKLAIVR